MEPLQRQHYRWEQRNAKAKEKDTQAMNDARNPRSNDDEKNKEKQQLYK